MDVVWLVHWTQRYLRVGCVQPFHVELHLVLDKKRYQWVNVASQRSLVIVFNPENAKWCDPQSFRLWCAEIILSFCGLAKKRWDAAVRRAAESATFVDLSGGIVWKVSYETSHRFRHHVTWLILPVVICLSQRLSHACLSISVSLRNCEWLIKTVIVSMSVANYLDIHGNSRANTCVQTRLLRKGCAY